jgi:hypothetical protein
MIAPPNAYKFGNILFPGGIAPHQQSHAGRLGSTISGFPPYTGVPPGRRPSEGRGGRTIVVPYAYPVYYPDYSGMQQQPNVTVVLPQQQPPSVVINNHYPDNARTGLREYSGDTSSAENAPPDNGGMRVYEAPKSAEAPKPATREPAASKPAQPPADDRPTIYLIALKDTTVRQAIGYWVEDETLHYVTPQGTINRVTLDMVDQSASSRFNAERNLEFELPSQANESVPRN